MNSKNWSTKPAEAAVIWDTVTKKYTKGKKSVDALVGLTLTIPKGQLFGLLGPNGAGKTTSLEIAVGLRRATSGVVTCLGLDPIENRTDITHRVGVQPQEVRLFEYLSVREILQAWAAFYPASIAADVLIDRLDMGSYCDRRVKTLSGGQLQRLHIALALVGSAELVVLDEPSAGLDPVARSELWSLLREIRYDGTSVIISTHSMEEAEHLCDRVAIVDGGRCVATGVPTELVEELGGMKLLEFTVDDCNRDVVHERASLLGTVTVGKSGRMLLEASNSDRAVVQLAELGDIRDLTVRRPGLREVYLSSVGKSLGHQGSAYADDPRGSK